MLIGSHENIIKINALDISSEIDLLLDKVRTNATYGFLQKLAYQDALLDVDTALKRIIAKTLQTQEIEYNRKYCPNCGARQDKEAEHE